MASDDRSTITPEEVDRIVPGDPLERDPADDPDPAQAKASDALRARRREITVDAGDVDLTRASCQGCGEMFGNYHAIACPTLARKRAAI